MKRPFEYIKDKLSNNPELDVDENEVEQIVVESNNFREFPDIKTKPEKIYIKKDLNESGDCFIISPNNTTNVDKYGMSAKATVDFVLDLIDR